MNKGRGNASSLYFFCNFILTRASKQTDNFRNKGGNLEYDELRAIQYCI